MRFYEKRFAEEYDRRLTREGYPGILLKKIETEIENFQLNKEVQNTEIIDVGAGSGFFSIPFAKKGLNLIAVEPSPEMIKIFRAKLDPETSDRIHITESAWETWIGKKSDVLICIHSLYPMKNIKKAILKMKESAEKSILLIKSDSGTDTLTGIIRDHFNKKKYTKNFSTPVKKILADNMIPYNIKNVIQERTSIFTDLGKEAEYYIYHLKLDNSALSKVKKIIKDNTTLKSNYYKYKSKHCDDLFIF